jgi:adenylosuccinate synthase
LHIDPQATLQTKEHQRTEQLAGITERLGSTAKGIGAARSARIWREAELYGERGAFLGNTAHIMRDQLQLGNTVIIEGTQGYGLGLHAGHYPQCTSSDCRALDFLAMAGISPWDPAVDKFTVWVTARVNPIRVAGNSGQLLGETTWEQLGLAEEHTTVTKKVRRVGEWDPDLIREAVQANGGAPVVKIALTMVDHLEPEIEGLTGPYELDEMPETVQDLVRQVERDANAPVGLIGTSDRTMITLGAFRG